MLGSKAGASTPLYLFRELTHGFLRDDTPVTVNKRSLGLIDRNKDLCTGTLAILPESKGLLYCVFFSQEPPAFNRLTHKSLLIGSQIYFHVLRVRFKKAGVKHGFCSSIDLERVVVHRFYDHCVKSPTWSAAANKDGHTM